MSRVTLSGRPPVTDGPGAPAPVNPRTGQHRDHWILSADERAKGFIRPVRRTYTHMGCGCATTMSLEIAETYARDPSFYGKTFCCGCREYLPLDQFVWFGTTEEVGS